MTQTNGIKLSAVEVKTVQRLISERTEIQQRANAEIQEINDSLTDLLDKVRRLAGVPDGQMRIEPRSGDLWLICTPPAGEAPAESEPAQEPVD